MPMVNVCLCRAAERTSFWSAKLFWEQVLQLNRPRCCVPQATGRRKASLCLILQGKCSGSIYPCDLNGRVCQKHCLLKKGCVYTRRDMAVHTYISYSGLSLYLAPAWFVSCKGTSVLMTLGFFPRYNFISLQNCFSTYLLPFTAAPLQLL